MSRLTHSCLGVLFTLASSFSVAAKPPGFVWLPGQIKASLARDDEYLRMGQYLLLEQELPAGVQGWTLMRIDLPESWRMETIAVRETAVVLTTEDAGSYELTRRNVAALSSAILHDDTPTDSELEQLWRLHADAGRRQPVPAIP